MGKLKQMWKGFGTFMAAYKVWGILQVLLPFALAAWAWFLSVADSLPLAVTVTLCLVVVSQGVLMLAAINYLLGRPVSVMNVNSAKFQNVLTFDGVSLAYSPPGSHDPSMQLILTLRNGSVHPIVYSVERFDFVISDATIANKQLPTSELSIPVFTVRTYADIPIRGATIDRLAGQKHEGSLEFHAVYRRQEDDKFARRYKLKLHLTIDLTFGQARLRELIQSETDERL